ncbi:MAG: reprolysin-like metallopeptidase [Nonlabens sp.]
MIKNILLLVAIISCLSTVAQEKNPWIRSVEKVAENELRVRKTTPRVHVQYAIDRIVMESALSGATSRFEPNAQSVDVILPTMTGFKVFEVYESSVMDPRLQNKYEGIKNYKGISRDGSGTTVRFTISPFAFHAVLHTLDQGDQYLDPIDKAGSLYTLYRADDLILTGEPSNCMWNEVESLSTDSSLEIHNADDSQIRTYRTAISATVEYSRFQYIQAGLNPGSPDADRTAAVLAAMNVTLARVNFIYERDLSISLVLVPNNDQLIFLDTDNLSNSNPGLILDENQSLIDSVIGTGNYDLGHVFTTGGGGVASLASVCSGNRKAQGVTGSAAPVGDPYDIDFVAHELGHQFGARHTFNGNTGSCQGGNRSASNAYEPGSGTTIMAYAGICAPQNVQGNSDAYFHQASLDEIWDYVSRFATCSSELTIANDPPTADAGVDTHVIPIDTPYRLEGSSTDPQGVALHTYTWEQYDLGFTSGLPDPAINSGPLVRSFEGTLSPVRYVPRLEDVVASGGMSTEWEKLSLVTRALNYNLTVRDNDVRGGQTAVDSKRIVVTASAGPFRVSSQSNTGITWLPNTQETITWNVANTNSSPINSSSVNILLSTDNGETFDTVLVSNTPNDGSEIITVPSGIVAPFCRLMIESADNIFFNVNSEVFSINAELRTVCNTYDSGALNRSIPDLAAGATSLTPIGDNIVIAPSTVADDVNISVDISHSYIQDMIIEVTNPDGVTTRLWNRECVSQDDIIMTFDDDGSAIDCSLSGSSGTYAPSSPLAPLAGSAVNGAWTMVMADAGVGDAGVWNNWSIEICSTEVVPLSNNEVDHDNSFVISPNPSNGNFSISSTIFSDNNSKFNLYDMSGRIVHTQDLSREATQTIKASNKISSGFYIAVVQTSTGNLSQKIVIK